MTQTRGRAHPLPNSTGIRKERKNYKQMWKGGKGMTLLRLLDKEIILQH